MAHEILKMRNPDTVAMCITAAATVVARLNVPHATVLPHNVQRYLMMSWDHAMEELDPDEVVGCVKPGNYTLWSVVVGNNTLEFRYNGDTAYPVAVSAAGAVVYPGHPDPIGVTAFYAVVPRDILMDAIAGFQKMVKTIRVPWFMNRSFSMHDRLEFPTVEDEALEVATRAEHIKMMKRRRVEEAQEAAAAAAVPPPTAAECTAAVKAYAEFYQRLASLTEVTASSAGVRGWAGVVGSD
jgi:hypothetical protein